MTKYPQAPRLLVCQKAIIDNYRVLQEYVGPSSVISAVLKADGYGIGARKIASILEAQGCRHFFVANALEGQALRTVLPSYNHIYILHGFDPHVADLYKSAHLTPVANTVKDIEEWGCFAAQQENTPLPFLVHIDTGLNRLGLPWNKAEDWLPAIQKASRGTIPYVMSHLSTPAQKHHPANMRQLERFKKVLKLFPNAKVSLAASFGTWLESSFHFDMLRQGINLYGCFSSPKNCPSLTFAFELQAPLLQVRWIEQGEAVGYEETYKAAEAKKIATYAIGYADCLPRRISNEGYTLSIDSYRAEIVGRINMDMISVDVTHIPDHILTLGSWASIFKTREEFWHLATLGKTNAHEFFSRLTSRCEKHYI